MSPSQHFQTYFDMCTASCHSRLEQVFHIRYQVYCKEFGYESEENCHEQKEIDQFDCQSRHTLLLHRQSNTPIGCVRLVESGSRHPQQRLPFEKYCARALDIRKFNVEKLPPGKVAELSRLALIGRFRRRSSDQGQEVNYPKVVPIHDQQRNAFPVIPISLFLAGLSMLRASDAEYGFAMMEPKLMRLLRWFGIDFKAVGKPIEYHGWRAPYIIHRDDAVRYLKSAVAALYEHIDNRLHRNCDYICTQSA